MARGRRPSTAPASAPAPAAKKAKVDPNLVGVQEAIKMHASLSESCQQMLIAGLPGAVGTQAGERQESQALIVGFVDETLAAVEAKFQADLDAQSARAQAIEQSRGDLEAEATARGAAAEAAAGDVQAKTDALAEAARRAEDAERALLGKEEEHRVADANYNKHNDKLAALQACLESEFKALADGQSETGQAHYEALLPLVKDAGLDESLAAALPSACQKKSGDRTSFDVMVIDSLGNSLREKAAALAKTVEEANRVRGNMKSANDTAKAELDSLKDSKTKHGEDLAQAQRAHGEAREALRRATEAVAAQGPGLEEATKLKDEKAVALENFRLYNKGCWELLKGPEPTPVAAAGA